MLIGLKQPLAAGEKVPLTLSFDGGTTVAVELEVREGGAGDHGH
jgi:copper(I)-binding protein